MTDREFTEMIFNLGRLMGKSDALLRDAEALNSSGEKPQVEAITTEAEKEVSGNESDPMRNVRTEQLPEFCP